MSWVAGLIFFLGLCHLANRVARLERKLEEAEQQRLNKAWDEGLENAALLFPNDR